jgi:transcriptional regulator
MTDGSLDLVQGTVDVLVLQTLAWGPMHGYAVASWIRQRTDGVLALEDAPLYKALHRLEKQGCVVAEWGLSENNRRARYYQLTPAGQAQLRERAGAWRRYARAVFQVLEPPADPAPRAV